MWDSRAASGNRLSARSSLTTASSSSSSSSFDSDATDPFASPRRSLSSSFDSPVHKRTITRALSISADSSWIKKKCSDSSDNEAPKNQPSVVVTASANQQPSTVAKVSDSKAPAAMAFDSQVTISTPSEKQSWSPATAPENQHAAVVTESENQPSTVATASDYSMSSDDEDFDNEQSSGETIRVTVRFRPLLSREKASGESAWSVHPQTHTITQVAFSSPSSSSGIPDAPLSSRVTKSSRRVYAFDEVYQERHSTRAIYDGVARSIARSALDGIHGSLFAYGQTSSGKTFTMQGSSLHHHTNNTGTGPETESDRRPLDSDGIIQLAVKDLFDEMARRQAVSTNSTSFVVKVSYIEIYNETVRDLLGETTQAAIVNVREHPVHGVFTDASERAVSSARAVLQALKDGEKSRAVGATNMNERSSRSHTLFRVTIESSSSCASADLTESVRVGCLNFVDLAGSESAQRTGAQGQRQVEAGNINRSLLALSRVVHALSSSSSRNEASSHISFRDSKLTRILQPSLSGAARVLFICCVSPAVQFVEDTKSTLKFASRAKRIQIHASVNEIINDDSSAKAQFMVKSLQQENETLRRDLEKLRDAQELATSLKKQIQMMEMEMLIRGGESRESLTGLLSSLELRESFRLSDSTSAFMLEEDNGDGDEYDGEYYSYGDNDNDGGHRYDSEGEVQPEEERESIGGMRASFFVENLIDPNEMTDDEEDDEDINRESPETVVEPEPCQHCKELQRQIEAARDLQTQQLSLEKTEHKRLKDLEEAQQRVQQLELDYVALQKLALETEASSQKKSRELEDQLAHASKLSQHQKQLLDAFQTQQQLEPVDDEERLLLAESGGVLGEDREHGFLHDRLMLLLTPPGGWGRTESTTLLVALVLICATLYVATGLRW